MADIPTVTDGNALDADTDWNPMATKVNDHEDRLLVIEGYESGSSTATIASGSNSGTKTITFTNTYTTAPFVFVTRDVTAGGQSGSFGAFVSDRSTTGFTATLFRADGSNAPSNQTVGFVWHAVPQ